MSLSLQDLAPGTFVPVLGALSAILDKGAAHARASGQDETALVQARLAPDMFTLAQQVQQACAHATNGTTRVTGRDAPETNADALVTFADLKAHIAATTAFLQAIPASAYDGAEERTITMGLMPGMELHMTAFQYLRDWSTPQFYFHMVTAYGILRNAGVEIGKRDFLSFIGYAIRPTSS